jgi:PIN domain nuclease of toxin-antitoxin system
MKLLLDTHIWLWTDQNPAKLARSVQEAISDPANERWLSPISIWEVVVLIEKKRITMHEEISVWLETSKEHLALREAPLTWEIAEEVRFTMPDRGDPADRFLAATAKVYGLTLVTSDQRLMNIPGISVLPNR